MTSFPSVTAARFADVVDVVENVGRDVGDAIGRTWCMCMRRPWICLADVKLHRKRVEIIHRSDGDENDGMAEDTLCSQAVDCEF